MAVTLLLPRFGGSDGTLLMQFKVDEVQFIYDCIYKGQLCIMNWTFDDAQEVGGSFYLILY